MIIVYTPEGGEPEQYDARTLKVSEASIVSRTIDQKWGEIKAGLPDEDLDAMRAIVWVLKKRSNPSLRFAEIDPGVDEMVTRFDRQEVVTYVENALRIRETDPEVTNEQLAEALADFPAAAVDRDHAERIIAEMTAEAPKDPAPGDEPTPEETTEAPTPTLSVSEASTSASLPTS
ncbi:hypothetical protein [Streptomyces sp. NRRL S-1824]|uniref:hypothetical protein n=1 Tax=Streptomyces sp. NRRL S-1824 TaxID=1463889 RepID=UPI0004CACF1A|nr:hypothetical protein [Streptomyces sp. NRRL S-1824]